MHGLINKGIERFVIDTYGQTTWLEVAGQARLGFTEFEAMLTYEPCLTDRMLATIAERLRRPREAVLEDFGTFLVASPSLPAIRRLMRFGGVTYQDFLHSLDELSDRVRLAMDDLILPQLTLIEQGQGQFRLRCKPGLEGFGHVMVGVLRAMADDYGALAVLDHHGYGEQGEEIAIAIVQDPFSEGKTFELGVRCA
ncbi:heme NO-binding domain-containing protein [Aestuariivita sp.]|jgi:hypothetical protein|uniref:heme NO-binding domain-containing protein n=1 Tax=Aestuariivita sp. TaxID=1872407 RepID=UPI002173EF61|nr:heme NO-binding domain-containing protein [Aestuariivita sp.]MCE8009376.1 heme NO-binding protein [Aestuariivita sp.]